MKARIQISLGHKISTWENSTQFTVKNHPKHGTLLINIFIRTAFALYINL